MKGLTKPQSDVLKFIEDYINSHGFSPSYREIMSEFKYASLGSVYNHIKALKKKGALDAEKRSRLMPLKQTVVQASEITLPLIGTIAAGFPLELFPHSQTIAVPPTLVASPENTYVLRAKGDTLIEEQISNGDLLLVEARDQASYGETVIALINQHDTIVKRYFPEDGYVRLEGSNPQFKPLILKANEIIVQGALVGLMRVYH